MNSFVCYHCQRFGWGLMFYSVSIQFYLDSMSINISVSFVVEINALVGLLTVLIADRHQTSSASCPSSKLWSHQGTTVA